MGRKEDRADMWIPMPCRFGEKADCSGRLLPLIGVSWFSWSWGTDHTYFFAVNDWGRTEIYSTYDQDMPFGIDIPDPLLGDKPIKEHGYPLRGKGYVNGVYYKYGITYVDFIITSGHYEHIRIQCDEKWEYIPGGDIIFPPSWDTEEKKERGILKAYKAKLDKDPVEKQLSIFDFIK